MLPVFPVAEKHGLHFYDVTVLYDKIYYLYGECELWKQEVPLYLTQLWTGAHSSFDTGATTGHALHTQKNRVWVCS